MVGPDVAKNLPKYDEDGLPVQPGHRVIPGSPEFNDLVDAVGGGEKQIKGEAVTPPATPVAAGGE
ncbi:MAG: hypothetical protein NTZ93_01970 [Candidatus Beckwithbacteria bacterium]|nr:hypothetical protein [Candidatus Beckwithbacteria bacterium]